MLGISQLEEQNEITGDFWFPFLFYFTTSAFTCHFGICSYALWDLSENAIDFLKSLNVSPVVL